MNDRVKAFRGAVVHCLGDPDSGPDDSNIEYFPDGLLCVQRGRVTALGSADKLMPALGPDAEIVDHTGGLIMPGFIDVHIHSPQTDIIASHGSRLLEWLQKYTFPVEARFENIEYAQEASEFFVNELLRNGTTTALVLGTVHPQSVDALFEAAQRRNMRMVAGKVLMDRNCPEYLRDTAESGYDQSRELIQRWHGVDRLLYAVTPRFAPTSTEHQLENVGRLCREYPDVFMHTHVAENTEEIAWVRELFPWSKSYLDVYDHYGLLRARSVYAHCIYLTDADRERMRASGAAVAFCPTSNLFLGSGLLDLGRMDGIRIGVGTDVGGGTSFNMMRTISEAYKVSQLAGYNLHPYRCLYLSTLGGARALYLDDYIGNFGVGKEADFVVHNLAATELLQRRLQGAESLSERLFALMMLGDDRTVVDVYVAAERVAIH